MDTSIKLGLEEAGQLVQWLSVPQAKTEKYFAMGKQGTNFYIPGEMAKSFSVWTDSVGPCHVVLVHGTPKSSGLGTIGLAHVSGKHEVIVEEARQLVEEMEKTMNCEVFIIGGDKEGVDVGHTFDTSSVPTFLQGKLKLVVSPVSDTGYVKVELTGARQINIEKHTG